MKTGRKCVLLLRACLQWDFKVDWLNAFIWKGSLRKAATWLETLMAVISQQQGRFWVLCSIKKQAAWIGLSWQLGWVSVWSGRKRKAEGGKKEQELVYLFDCQWLTKGRPRALNAVSFKATVWIFKLLVHWCKWVSVIKAITAGYWEIQVVPSHLSSKKRKKKPPEI